MQNTFNQITVCVTFYVITFYLITNNESIYLISKKKIIHKNHSITSRQTKLKSLKKKIIVYWFP